MSKAESAELILKLYDLRREDVMRKARNWVFTFNPTSAEEYDNMMMNPETGAYLRMVTSYWDMAASMVVHGAIDPEMFDETNSEHIIVFAKIEPILADLRERWQRPDAFKNLEKVVLDSKDGAERVKKTQEWLRSIAEQIATQRSNEAAA